KGRKIEHVGLETGSLSQWLHAGLSKEGFRVSIMEARHVRAAFAAMRVKTDRNDARGIAQLVRLGWFKSVHVKAPTAQETRALLNGRQFIVDKVTGIENSMRANLRNFGLKVGAVSRTAWPHRARELAAGVPALEMLIESMLKIREALLQELRLLDRKLLEGDCQESCAVGHRGGKKGTQLWRSRRIYWTSFFRVATRKRFSAATGLSMS
ncbi:MAG: IS110 family transposase, partial [Pseudomonadota bacterium]